MENKIFYLQDGQQCSLVEKRKDGKFLVDPHCYYDEYNEEEGQVFYTKPGNSLILVDQIFNTAPLPAIAEDFKKLNTKIKEKKEELQLINGEVNGLIQQKTTLEKGVTDLNKWIIDLRQFRNAKTRACFLKNEPYPTTIGYEGDNDYRKDTITFEFRIKEYSIQDVFMAWYCRNNGSDFTARDIDPGYGFLFDVPEEELTRIALERNKQFNVDDLKLWTLERCPEKYFTPAMTEKYNKLKAIEDEAKRQKLINDIAKQQQELDKLTSLL